MPAHTMGLRGSRSSRHLPVAVGVSHRGGRERGSHLRQVTFGEAGGTELSIYPLFARPQHAGIYRVHKLVDGRFGGGLGTTRVELHRGAGAGSARQQAHQNTGQTRLDAGTKDEGDSDGGDVGGLAGGRSWGLPHGY